MNSKQKCIEILDNHIKELTILLAKLQLERDLMANYK